MRDRLACPKLQPRSGVFVSPGRDCQALGVPNFSRVAAFLLDAMAALPRKWVSGGLRLVAYASESAPTLPMQTIALPRGVTYLG
jgi:hypothetical protein